MGAFAQALRTYRCPHPTHPPPPYQPADEGLKLEMVENERQLDRCVSGGGGVGRGGEG